MLCDHGHSQPAQVWPVSPGVNSQHAMFLFLPSKEQSPHPSSLSRQLALCQLAPAAAAGLDRGWLKWGEGPMSGWEEFWKTLCGLTLPPCLHAPSSWPLSAPREKSHSWLSTGWFTMVIAVELCDHVHVYGMVPPDYCRWAPPGRCPAIGHRVELGSQKPWLGCLQGPLFYRIQTALLRSRLFRATPGASIPSLARAQSLYINNNYFHYYDMKSPAGDSYFLLSADHVPSMAFYYLIYSL